VWAVHALPTVLGFQELIPHSARARPQRLKVTGNDPPVRLRGVVKLVALADNFHLKFNFKGRGLFIFKKFEKGKHFRAIKVVPQWNLGTTTSQTF
jgi:hypothetical protein